MSDESDVWTLENCAGSAWRLESRLLSLLPALKACWLRARGWLRVTHRPAALLPDLPDSDASWSQDDWKQLLEYLIGSQTVSWREVCSLVLGHLNPPQVGTSIASKGTFQRHFPKRETWRAVRQWFFRQRGACSDCGTRLELQADHIVPRELVGKVGMQVAEAGINDRRILSEELGDVLEVELKSSGYEESGLESLREAIIAGLCDAILDGVREQHLLANVADRLENMVLRCRRCNVVRRPSHKRGGQTFLTAEAALMWILMVKRPKTYQEFAGECRSYGLTMADIRFQEAWAMAMWLGRSGAYVVESTSKFKPSP